MEMNFSKLLRMRADQYASGDAYLEFSESEPVARIYREIADMFDSTISECGDGRPSSERRFNSRGHDR